LCGLIIRDIETINNSRKRSKRPEECIPLRTSSSRKERERDTREIEREGEREKKREGERKRGRD